MTTIKINESEESMSAEEMHDAVQAKSARPILPPFEIKPFLRGQQVTLAELKKATQVLIPNANIAVRSLNASHVQALKIAYQSGEKMPPLELLNTTHGIVIIAGNHRNQAMRDALVEQLQLTDSKGLPIDTESALPKEALPEFQELLKQYLVNYVPVKNIQNMYDLEDLNDKIFLNNLTHGLPPSGENRSRYAIYLIARAARRGQKMTQQEAADIVHVSRVAVARQVMRDTAKAEGTTVEAKAAAKKQILPADYVAEDEAEPAMETASEQIQARKKSIDPLLDATLAVFNNMRIIHAEMLKTKTTPEELTSYLSDIAGKNLTGFTIDEYAFECLTTAIVTMFKK